MDAKLADIKDVCFPGAFAKEPIGTVWKGWVASSIFSRSDLDTTTKIRFYRQGAICLDEGALKPVLRLAYERCASWTQFVCENEGINEHEKVEKFVVEKMYDAALQALKKDLDEEIKQTRPQKDGPLGFAAPEWASTLEKDGMKGGIHTVVVRSFKELREKLNEWRSYGTWVITLPVDENWTPEEIKEICTACAEHLTEGGKIVIAWTPCVQANATVWPKMLGVWRTVD
ncbi:hypothetical protein Y032_0152g2897 [Ancylostoma ceylanicum]|uniref:Uncharacterized protein n=1 Tax=Ancylostoma ceylanicum TaxID=53326 RepID=A0A016T0L4_9BILA|nr:hypothetical protein Y032_0152g2897 [Ancylostoma ceylanicum]